MVAGWNATTSNATPASLVSLLRPAITCAVPISLIQHTCLECLPAAAHRNSLHHAHGPPIRCAAVTTILHRLINTREIWVLAKHEPLVFTGFIRRDPVPQTTLRNRIVCVREHLLLHLALVYAFKVGSRHFRLPYTA